MPSSTGHQTIRRKPAAGAVPIRHHRRGRQSGCCESYIDYAVLSTSDKHCEIRVWNNFGGEYVGAEDGNWGALSVDLRPGAVDNSQLTLLIRRAFSMIRGIQNLGLPRWRVFSKALSCSIIVNGCMLIKLGCIKMCRFRMIKRGNYRDDASLE